MIHVHIASELTAEGVRGVRWVLLEAPEPLQPEVSDSPPFAELTSSAPVAPLPAFGPPDIPPVADVVVDSLRLRLLKALVVVAGLGAALWTAAVQIGLPGQRVPAAPGAASAATLPPKPDTAASSAPAGSADRSGVEPSAPGAASTASSARPRTPVVKGSPAAAKTAPSTPASGSRPRLTASL